MKTLAVRIPPLAGFVVIGSLGTIFGVFLAGGVASAYAPIGGVVLGVLIAQVVQLTRDHRQFALESEKELKDLYASFLGDLNSAGLTAASGALDDPNDASIIERGLKHVNASATRLNRLLITEPRAEARLKLSELNEQFALFAASFSIGDRDPSRTMQELAEVYAEIATFVRWLGEVRFGLEPIPEANQGVPSSSSTT